MLEILERGFVITDDKLAGSFIESVEVSWSPAECLHHLSQHTCSGLTFSDDKCK